MYFMLRLGLLHYYVHGLNCMFFTFTYLFFKNLCCSMITLKEDLCLEDVPFVSRWPCSSFSTQKKKNVGYVAKSGYTRVNNIK